MYIYIYIMLLLMDVALLGIPWILKFNYCCTVPRMISIIPFAGTHDFCIQTTKRIQAWDKPGWTSISHCSAPVVIWQRNGPTELRFFHIFRSQSSQGSSILFHHVLPISNVMRNYTMCSSWPLIKLILPTKYNTHQRKTNMFVSCGHFDRSSSIIVCIMLDLPVPSPAKGSPKKPKSAPLRTRRPSFSPPMMCHMQPIDALLDRHEKRMASEKMMEWMSPTWDLPRCSIYGIFLYIGITWGGKCW